MRIPALALALAACTGDETVSGYVPGGTTFRLDTLDGTPFPARATLGFPDPGRVTGSGPCNGFRASQSVPYPWIEIGPLAATRAACPDLPAEGRYFAALRQMTTAEALGGLLILRSDAGREMVFQAEN